MPILRPSSPFHTQQAQNPISRTATASISASLFPPLRPLLHCLSKSQNWLRRRRWWGLTCRLMEMTLRCWVSSRKKRRVEDAALACALWGGLPFPPRFSSVGFCGGVMACVHARARNRILGADGDAGAVLCQRSVANMDVGAVQWCRFSCSCGLTTRFNSFKVPPSQSCDPGHVLPLPRMASLPMRMRLIVWMRMWMHQVHRRISHETLAVYRTFVRDIHDHILLRLLSIHDGRGRGVQMLQLLSWRHMLDRCNGHRMRMWRCALRIRIRIWARGGRWIGVLCVRVRSVRCTSRLSIRLLRRLVGMWMFCSWVRCRGRSRRCRSCSPPT